MKYTEKQILEKTKKILQDLQGQFYNEENIKNARFSDKKELSRPEGKTAPVWTVSIDEPVFDAWEFLTISDETGEPLYYQNANMIIHEIQKDDKGNYY